MTHQPVRDPARVKGKKGSYVGYFPSRKMNRSIAYESTGELYTAILYELDPQVTKYVEQPYRFKFTYEGAESSYTPDFLVIRNGEKWIEEVKPDERVRKPEIHKRLLAEKALVEGKGFKFRVVTEKVSMRQPRLRNAEIILRYAYPDWREQDQKELLSALNNTQNQTIKSAIERLGTDDALSIICTGACVGLLELDMSQPFSHETSIKLFNKENRHVC